MAPHFRLSQKSSLLRIRANPRRGFALFSALNGLRIHPLLRFLKAKGDFAVCGRRQGLLALDLGRFFCKKSSAKKLQKGFATSSFGGQQTANFLFSLNQFFRNINISICTLGMLVKIHGRHTEGRCFRKTHISRNRSFEYLVGKMLFQLLKHLKSKVKSSVKHGYHNT